MKKRDSSSEKGGILAMEERAKGAPEAAGFNRKRAEGRDESDRPKKLQLKVRTLNPANTICYVQVSPMVSSIFFYFLLFGISWMWLLLVLCCLNGMFIVSIELILLLDLIFVSCVVEFGFLLR